MNLLYDELPQEVEVSGEARAIRTDFRDWIAFIDMMGDKDLTDHEKLALACDWFEGTPPVDLAAALRALLGFFRGGELPQCGVQSGRAPRAVFSYRYDAGYVLAAYREVYGIDLLRIEYMHWWEFRSLFDALPDTCELKRRIQYRAIDPATIKDPRERSRIRRIQREIALPNEVVSDTDIGDAFAM